MLHFHKGKAATFVVLALTIFIFLFALNAKLALCHPTGPEQSRTAFKLYLNGQKLDIVDSFPEQQALLGFVTWLLFFTLSLLARRPVRVTPSDVHRPLFRFFSLSHFFRPPPAFILSF